MFLTKFVILRGHGLFLDRPQTSTGDAVLLGVGRGVPQGHDGQGPVWYKTTMVPGSPNHEAEMFENAS